MVNRIINSKYLFNLSKTRIYFVSLSEELVVYLGCFGGFPVGLVRGEFTCNAGDFG